MPKAFKMCVPNMDHIHSEVDRILESMEYTKPQWSREKNIYIYKCKYLKVENIWLNASALWQFEVIKIKWLGREISLKKHDFIKKTKSTSIFSINFTPGSQFI